MPLGRRKYPGTLPSLARNPPQTRYPPGSFIIHIRFEQSFRTSAICLIHCCPPFHCLPSPRPLSRPGLSRRSPSAYSTFAPRSFDAAASPRFTWPRKETFSSCYPFRRVAGRGRWVPIGFRAPDASAGTLFFTRSTRATNYCISRRKFRHTSRDAPYK